MTGSRKRGRGDGWEERDEGEEGGERPGARFRERALAGEYEGLRAAGVARTVMQAGAAPGLQEEIGMVRVALSRLLEEETDASAFATGVARLVSVAVQAARVERDRERERERERARPGGGAAALEVEALVRRLVEEGHEG
jgi:hypothetical protein